MAYPYDFIDPYARLSQAPALTRRPTIPPITPEEEESQLSKIAGVGLGGLGYVGSVLDKTFGGRAIRGLLGGKPRELLSPIPFSDWTGLTDEADRVGGRELLRNVGLAGEEDTWGNFLGGMATELALDPGMYMTFGGRALTKGGELARKVGALPTTTAGRVRTTLGQALDAADKVGPGRATGHALDVLRASGETLAQHIDKPLGYSVGFGLPFARPVTGLGESGLTAANLALSGVKGLDAAARMVPFLGPQYGGMVDMAGKGLGAAGRLGGALLRPATMGFTHPEGQIAAEAAYAGKAPLVAGMKKKAAEWVDQLKAAGIDPEGGELRRLLEDVPLAGGAQPHPELARVAAEMKAELAAVPGRAQALGLPLHEVEDLAEIGYAPRYHVSASGAGRRKGSLAAAEHLRGRKPVLKGFTEGTEGVNQFFRDPALYAAVHAGTPLAAHKVARGYLSPKLLPGETALEAAARLDKQADDLVTIARGLGPEYAKGARYFPQHPLGDFVAYSERLGDLLPGAEAVQGMFARTAMHLPGHAAVPAGARPYAQALADAGLTFEQGAHQAALQRLAERFGGQPPASLANYYVPGDVAGQAASRLLKTLAPEAVSQVGALADAANVLTKTYQTAVWPAFNVRNRFSGAFENIGELGLPGWWRARGDARAMLAGKTVPDALDIPGMARRFATPEEASRELAREGYAWGAGGPVAHAGRDPVTGLPAVKDLDAFRGQVPGTTPITLRSVWDALRGNLPGQKTSRNPLALRGVMADEDLFTPVAAGRRAGDIVENQNRMELLLGARRRGDLPEVAGPLTTKTQFDYTPGAKTAFEREWLSRLIPFYTFSRANIPRQVEKLITQPGGMAGTAARVSEDLRQDVGFLPSYMGSGLAIPLGAEEEGMRRYLTRLDLPAEQAFEMLKGGANWPQDTAMSALSQFNPLVKGPLEAVTGKQFFSGRDVGDLYSTTGSAALDQALAMSPLSRAGTTWRTLTDPRKYAGPGSALAIPLNLLSGVRVSDVDVAKARDIAGREYVKEELQGLPAVGKFESIYLRPGMEHLLTPDELNLYRLNKAIQKRAVEAAKKKRQEQGGR